jgi:hypothetical protein
MVNVTLEKESRYNHDFALVVVRNKGLNECQDRANLVA